MQKQTGLLRRGLRRKEERKEERKEKEREEEEMAGKGHTMPAKEASRPHNSETKCANCSMNMLQR